VSDSILAKGAKLREVIAEHRTEFGSVLRPALAADNVLELRISEPGNIISDVPMAEVGRCWKTIESELKSTDKVAAIGGYAEKRTAYRINPELFGASEEERCIHLGTDIWVAEGTTIYAPLDATVHSFADNASLGNYGPTIILEHKLDGVTFYSLYGHLSRASLVDKKIGQSIAKGDPFATVGAPSENGNWVTHLHYQFIADMLDNEGDFIGVATESQADFYLSLCPEPVVF
jgi:murein DD-endopeptidase MepM/ murein hydrolase activator NlpD